MITLLKEICGCISSGALISLSPEALENLAFNCYLVLHLSPLLWWGSSLEQYSAY